MGSWTGWQASPVAFLAVAGVAAYLWAGARSRHRELGWRRACVVAGGLVVVLATAGPVGAAASTDVRARALAVVLLLYVAPLAVAHGRPVTVAGGLGRGRVAEWFRRSRPARRVLHPVTTSVGLLVLPWLLMTTGWLGTADRSRALDAATALLLLLVGSAYFHARLQLDPVPRRYPAFLSLGVSLVESLADGILGLVLWLGPVLPAVAVQATDPDRARFLQVVAAGILWIGGDVAGLPFLASLLVGLREEDARRAAELDTRLDAGFADDGGGATSTVADDAGPVSDQPWWETDPRFAGRYGGRR